VLDFKGRKKKMKKTKKKRKEKFTKDYKRFPYILCQ